MRFEPLPSMNVEAIPADGFLLDVREHDEWVAGHAEGAMHIPMGEFTARFGELAESLPHGKPVHVLCRVGGRSAQVTHYLIQQGLDAVNIEGGMLAWDAAGRPMVSEGDDPAFVL